LQSSVQDKSAFAKLEDYLSISLAFLSDLRHYQASAAGRRGNRQLDGVYYVDPRPEMLVNEKLREQIRDLQQFLIQDLWTLSGG
jgi:hypothetical protein